MKNLKLDIIPLVVSILILLIGFGVCLTSNFVFGYRQYIAIISLIIATSLYFKKKKVYFIFFAIVLTLGIFGVLDFYYKTYRVGFVQFGINPVYVGLLILFFALSKNQINKFFPEKNGKQKKVLDKDLVNSFESKFKSKTARQLKDIADVNSKFTDEAKEVARVILKKKNNL